jgi:hypothetical protein
VFSIRYEQNISVRVLYSFWSVAVRAMVHAVTRRPLAPEARVRSQASPSVRFILDTVALRQVQHFSPLTVIPPLLNGHFHRLVALTMQIKARSLGTFKTSNAVSHIGSVGRRGA